MKRDYYEPKIEAKGQKTAVKKPLLATLAAAPVAQVEALGAEVQPEAQAEGVQGAEVEAQAQGVQDMQKAFTFWTQAINWVNTWCKEDSKKGTINEFISPGLSQAILDYLEGDTKEKENVEKRLKQLQWWAKAIVEDAAAPGGMKDLRRVCKEFIWDSFFKGPEQIAMIEAPLASADEGGNEQFIKEGSITATRYLDLGTKEPVYFCGPGTPCPPSITRILLASKTDLAVNAKANKLTASPLYGFMVIWENAIMFKTNTATNAEGAPPGPGAACSIVSTVKGHRMKLVELGTTLNRYTGNHFELLEDTLATGARKLVGAVPFCALMEIVLRWMDIRKDLYGGKRYFYRPLASFYSKHKSKK